MSDPQAFTHPAEFPAGAIRAAYELAINPARYKDDPGRYFDELILVLHWAGHQVVGDPKSAGMTKGLAMPAVMRVPKPTDRHAAAIMKSLLAEHESSGPSPDDPEDAEDDAEDYPDRPAAMTAKVKDAPAKAAGPNPGSADHTFAAGMPAGIPTGAALAKWVLHFLVNMTGLA